MASIITVSPLRDAANDWFIDGQVKEIVRLFLIVPLSPAAATLRGVNYLPQIRRLPS